MDKEQVRELCDPEKNGMVEDAREKIRIERQQIDTKAAFMAVMKPIIMVRNPRSDTYRVSSYAVDAVVQHLFNSNSYLGYAPSEIFVRAEMIVKLFEELNDE